MRRVGVSLVAAALCGAACGGSNPMGPDVPDPEPGELEVVVFYDEDGDGVLGAGEQVRLPGVSLGLVGQSAVTDSLGRARFVGVSPGSVELSLDPDSLPPFYAAPASRQLGLPQNAAFAYPVSLPVGSNRRNVYMAFGDSITVGELSEDGRGWVGRLEEMLRGHFGAAELANEGISATRSNRGADRIEDSLARIQPAWTLVFYGVNDYNDFECRISAPCFTVDSLRFILEAIKSTDSLPVIATLTPSNTGYDFRAPPFRNIWVEGQNSYIRDLAAEQGAVLVDLHAAFLSFGAPNESGLIADHIHPNDQGYQVVADTFFEALLHGRPEGVAASRPLPLAWAAR
jgi:lysophospholipase L1-like esterase